MSNVDRYGIEQAADCAKELGFSGVEFFFMANHPELIPDIKTAKKYKALLEERGLSTPCVSVGVSLVRNDKPDEICKGDLDGALSALEFAAALGARLFHHTLIMGLSEEKTRGLEYDGIFSLVLDGASIIAKRAAELGVTVLYEPQGKYFNGHERLGKFYKEMKKSYGNVGICCDLGNSFWVGEEPYGFFEEFSKDIKHIHLKDYLITDAPIDEKSAKALQGGKYISEAEVGTGVVDMQKFYRLWHSIDYDGFMSLEDYVNIRPPEVIAKIMKRIDSDF